MAKKILLTGDDHFGVPGRLNDILWAKRVKREYAHRNDIDLTLGLGDLFHDRSALAIDALCACHDFYAESKKKYGQREIWFPGNHDMFLKHSWAVNSLRPFSGLLDIIDTVKVLEIEGVRFWILPFIHFEAAYMRVLDRIEGQYQRGDVLLTHIGTMGAVKNFCFLLKEWSQVSFDSSPFDQVYTGHFHAPQQVGRNVYYPGSPIPFKADEGDCDHGFFVYDLEKRQHEFVSIWEKGLEYFPNEVPPPNYLTVPDDDINNLPDEIVRHNILRVAVTRDYTPNESAQVVEYLMGRGAKAVRWINVAGEEEAKQIRAELLEGEQRDMFELWLSADRQAVVEQSLDQGLLRSFNKSIVLEADERYQSEQEAD